MNESHTKNSFKKFFESDRSTKVLMIIGSLLVVGIIFQAGVAVGFHKASFGRNRGDHYYENFGPKRGGNAVKKMDRQFPNAHGAVGKILKIDLPTIMVEDRTDAEKVILIQDSTKIIRQDQVIASSELKIDDFIVVVGSPNSQGQIEAKLVRVMPVPPEKFSMPVQKNNFHR